MFSRLPSLIAVAGGRRSFSTEGKHIKWDIVSAICLERRPVITKQLSDLEKQMLSFCQQVEVEDSLKSDFEVTEEEESSGHKTSENQGRSIISLRDVMDGWEKELHETTLTAVRTEADKAQDFQSLERKLDSRLFFVNQEYTGKHWLFPQGVCNDGESLRDTAARVLVAQCGPSLKARFLSNAPCGFFHFKYPKELQKSNGGSVGAKVFFYKAELIEGKVQSNGFRWLTKTELLSTVDKKYGRSINKFLFND